MLTTVARQQNRSSGLLLAFALAVVPAASAQSPRIYEPAGIPFEFGFPDATDSSVVCESQGGGYRHCRANTRDGAYLLDQFSKSACIRGRSWDYDRHGIWVDEGCRGEFGLGRPGRRSRWDDDRDDGRSGYERSMFPRAQTLYCGSDDNRPRRCNVTVRRDARMTHQSSKAPCIEGTSWGWDRDGVWVNQGCRGEFQVD
ncbi:DUF3011 domain-containing protein [Lysobacter sp. GCM10012299]|uniref:DUF3011 domain-containing protein n=1 Tax=Lysobacter sp. GCM10012299 TaxID=3317333 RepID=UPI00361D3C2B